MDPTENRVLVQIQCEYKFQVYIMHVNYPNLVVVMVLHLTNYANNVLLSQKNLLSILP